MESQKSLNQEPFLTAKELAKILKLTPQTIYNLSTPRLMPKGHLLPRVRVSKKAYRYRLSEVLKFLEENKNL